MALGTFKMTLRLRDWHIFMWQSLKILNISNALTLKQVFWKTKTFSEKLAYRFLVVKVHYFHSKLLCQKPMLRQIEWGVKKGPITKTAVFTAWKVSKYRVFFSPYFSAFGLNTERHFVSLRIQSEYGKYEPEKTFSVRIVNLMLQFLKCTY